MHLYRRKEHKAVQIISLADIIKQTSQQDPEPQTDLMPESPLDKEGQQQEAHSCFRPTDLHTRVVEVELALERLGLLLWGEDPVETVLAEDGHLPLVVIDFVLPKQLHDLAAHRRLATQGENKTSSMIKYKCLYELHINFHSHFVFSILVYLWPGNIA